jgi:hypothetical protein
MRTFAKIAGVLVCGYGLFGKTFAYIGVPPAKVFIGDLFLAAFMLFCGRAVFRPLLDGLLHPREFSRLYWGMIVFVSYGFVELARGLALDYPPIPAMQELVVNIYPFYFFVGLWAALIYPDIVPKTIKFISWVCVFYALAYFLVLRKSKMVMPGSDIPMFPGPSAGLALFGITYFEKEIRRWWIPIGANLFIVLASQIRAEWLCLGAALALQSILTGKIRRLVWSVAALGAILALGFITDVNIPSPAGRGVTTVSSREIVARAVAAVDKEAAYDYSRKNAAFYAGTVSWRQRWWKAIWPSVHVDTETALLGHGYGFPLSGLVPYLRSFGADLRTPHNIFFYALGYTGWIGVVILFSFQAVVGYTMFRAWQVTGQPFGIVFWLSAMIGAFFGDFFEAPQSAIPYYLTIGMVAADLVAQPVRAAVSPNPSREVQQRRSQFPRFFPAFATSGRVWR